MASFATITPDKLSRLVGTPGAPLLVDVRDPDMLVDDPFVVPGAIRRDWRSVSSWAGEVGTSVITICQKGKKLSEGAAAWLRTEQVVAESLEGGIEAWRAAGLPLVPLSSIPSASGDGTLWVTRSRPKIDRIACPWLIRRFVDPRARFLFVAAAEVEAVADRFGATPFDIEGVRWSHRDDLCTFDVMIDAFGLSFDALKRLAVIVRAADTGRLDLAPEAPGLLAASLGLSRMFGDDVAQLEAGMALYDAFFRWARDATDEVHNWPGRGTRP